MPTPPEFGRRKHFEGDGCDAGKHEAVPVYPYEPRETLADQLKRIGDEAISRRELSEINDLDKKQRSGW